MTGRGAKSRVRPAFGGTLRLCRVFLRKGLGVGDTDQESSPESIRQGKGRPVDRADLAALETRLRRLKETHREPVREARRANAIGSAFRLTTELVAGVIVGAAIGWSLDRFIGSQPVFLLVFLFLGIAAGVVNVFRTAQRMNAEAGTGMEEDREGPKGPNEE